MLNVLREREPASGPFVNSSFHLKHSLISMLIRRTVGDPIECAAIGNVFAEGRTLEDPLLIGSIKTNLGHCEGASGLAAIIKAVHCLEKACIPATIGVKQLNPNSKHNVPLAERIEIED
jgi:3-oxoacyl-(acyl-carrier-protein) synthase